MNSPKLDACQAELKAALDLLLPELEGFDDYRGVDLKPVSDAENEKQIADADLLRIRLQNTIAAIIGLKELGYPEVKIMEVEPEVYDDLEGQLNSMTAAFKRYKKGPGPATGGVVEIVPPED